MDPKEIEEIKKIIQKEGLDCIELEKLAQSALFPEHEDPLLGLLYKHKGVVQ